MSQSQIETVAAMLTDDPDILNEDVLTEWWGSGAKLSAFQQKLMAATGIKDPKKLQQLELEVNKFIQYRPELQQQGEDAILKAFVTFKKTGNTPLRKELPQDMNQLGFAGSRNEHNQRKRRII